MELRDFKTADRTKSLNSRPCSSNVGCSPSHLQGSNYFPTSPSWPNEWEGVYNDSESSDWLSHSVASSTSWSDEMEGELTKRVQDQWRQFEHSLYKDGSEQEQEHLGVAHPLRQECRLWQLHSAHLRIVGHAIKPSVGCQTRSPLEEAEEQIEEIIAAHGDYDEKAPCQEDEIDDPPEENEVYKEKIKKAVIDQIFARIWPDVVKRIEPALQRTGKHHEDIFTLTPEIGKNREDSVEDLTSGFGSLTIGEDLSFASLRTRSGRQAGSSARKNVTVVPIKPVVLECSIPVPSSVARTASAVRKSPARLAQIKHPSPERLLSPLVVHGEIRTAVKSANGRKSKPAERRETRPRPQYDPMTGRMIAREETRSGLRRNLKTSPPVPWSRHGALPPIETTEILPKMSKCKRSTSAMFKGGRLNSGSRPNTSLNAKYQVVLSPLDSLQIRQTCVGSGYSRDSSGKLGQHSYANCENIHVRPSDQRQRWKNRSNVVKKL